MVSPARASFNVRLPCYNSRVIATYAVLYHPEAEAERDRLPRNERLAIATAVEKLETFGPNLPSPHQSKVMGAIDLRELRPRAGRSPWRPLYRRVAEDTFVIAAIAPEAQARRRGFQQAARRAERRLKELDT
jgi:hypothetical protein